MENLINSLIPDPDCLYDCSPYKQSTGFHLIHRLVLNTQQHPELNDYIEQMIDNNSTLLEIQNSKGWTPLMLAVRNSGTISSEITVKLLIDKGANVNAQLDNEYTPLFLSAPYTVNDGSTENTVKLLIDAGADINYMINNGLNILIYLNMIDNKISYNIVKILIDAKIDINLQSNIHRASFLMYISKDARNIDDNIIELLIKAGADIDLIDNSGWTALMYASKYSNTTSNIKIVKTLIDAGANLNLVNNDGRSALILASRYANTTSAESTVKMLIEAGANLDLVTNEGWSALMSASRYANSDSTEYVVKMLIDHRANLNIINNNKTMNAITLAIMGSMDNTSTKNVVQLLIDGGAYLNKIGKQNYSLLYAIESCNDLLLYEELSKLLLNANIMLLSQDDWNLENTVSDELRDDLIKYAIMNHSAPSYQYIDLEMPLDIKINCLLKNLRILKFVLKNTKNGQYLYDLCIKIINDDNIEPCIDLQLCHKIKEQFAKLNIISQINEEIIYAYGNRYYGPESINAKLAKEHFISLIN